MESRSIPRLLLQFSTPAVLASLVSVTYNLVARIFVAKRFGMDGVAALTVSFPVVVLFLAISMMIGTGATIIISIRLGERNNDKAEEALGQALLLSAVTAALFIFFGQLFLDPILRFVGATGDAADPNSVFSLAKSYISVIIWGVFVQHIAYGVNNFLRAEGKPLIAMVSMFLSAIVNIVLGYYFLLVLKTGAWGAGLANVIASAVAASWICYLYFSGKTVLRCAGAIFGGSTGSSRKRSPFAGRFLLQLRFVRQYCRRRKIIFGALWDPLRGGKWLYFRRRRCCDWDDGNSCCRIVGNYHGLPWARARGSAYRRL